jgi:BNR repeat-containing family member
MIRNSILLFFLLTLSVGTLTAQQAMPEKVLLSDVGPGWAGNSINAVVFRKNALVSFQDQQFIAYYDQEGSLVLGQRKHGESTWKIKKTAYKGNIKDAHNSISIMLDGKGFLHVAWDHHNNPLHYAKSIEPLSLELTPEMPMIGSLEKKVTYPEFYRMPDGNLLFFYRDGGSGNGNLVMNKYNTQTGQWTRLQQNLVDGEGKRNAYWQGCVDAKGNIHLSWVWRESPDVASNHDMSYAVSKDGGISWQKSDGVKYAIPITMATAEVICSIPQASELINQTSMCTDSDGNPFIASYWKGANNVPQYHIIYKSKKGWQVSDLGFRKMPFSLSGAGTKQIPISRPQVVCSGKGKKAELILVFRDAERDNAITVATKQIHKKGNWALTDLLKQNTGSWEPTYDTERWKDKQELYLFVQQVSQADAEGVVAVEAKMVRVLEWNKGRK